VPLCDPRSPLISIIGADFDRAAFRLSVFKPANFHDVGAAASKQLAMGSPETVSSRLSKAKRDRASAAETSAIGIDQRPESMSA